MLLKGALIFQSILLFGVLVQAEKSSGVPCVDASRRCKATPAYCLNLKLRLRCKKTCGLCILDHCQEYCPEIYEPVCGTDGNTYENSCTLQLHACSSNNPDLKVQHEGQCKECKKEGELCAADRIGIIHCCEEGLRCDVDITGQGYCRIQDCICGENCINLDGSQGVCQADNQTCAINVIPPNCNPNAECPEFCGEIYAPVCGTDGKTYPNECELQAHACYTHDDNLKVKHDGECKDAECPGFCGEIYAPVCGTDGNTYDNECELKVQACYTHNHDLKVKHEGKCKVCTTDIDCEEFYSCEDGECKCLDKGQCNRFATKEACEDTTNPKRMKWIQEKCPKTCGICGN